MKWFLWPRKQQRLTVALLVTGLAAFMVLVGVCFFMRKHERRAAEIEYSAMTNAYQRLRVYAGSFAGNLQDAYIQHRSAAERLGSVQRRSYSSEYSFVSIREAQRFALKFEKIFPHVPIEVSGYQRNEKPFVLVWADSDDLAAVERFIGTEFSAMQALGR